MLKLHALSLSLLLALSTLWQQTNALSTHEAASMAAAAAATAAAVIVPPYAITTGVLCKAMHMLRDEVTWKNRLVFRFTEDDRLLCRWAEDIWRTGQELADFAYFNKHEFAKAIDTAARGGWKRKYIGSRFYLVEFVRDLEAELQQLESYRGYLLFANYCLPGLRTKAAETLAKLDYYVARGQALKTAIVVRQTYQEQVEGLHKQDLIANVDQSVLQVHTDC